VAKAGKEIEVSVGATLADGTPVTFKAHCADGFDPSVGQSVAVVYATDSPHSGMAAAVGSAAAAAPGDTPHSLNSHTGTLDNNRLTNPKAAFCITLAVASVSSGAVNTTLQAATNALAGVALTVLGVTVFATGIAGTADPTVDVYEGAASILSAPQAVAAAGTVYEPTVTDASIANAATLSVRCTTDADGSLTGLTVGVWVKAAHLA